MARTFAADYMKAAGREDLSTLVRQGAGDDFPEVGLADDLLAAHARLLQRYEEALAQYADLGFWDDATPGGALVLHDNGQMARNVLAGRPAFFHRD